MVSNKLASALNEVGYNGDIKTENIENTIYEATKNKTRVVITGTEKRNEITAVILHVLQFHGIETDFITEENYSNAQLSTENDFVIIEAIPNEFLEIYAPTLHLLQTFPMKTVKSILILLLKLLRVAFWFTTKKMLR
jgi:UDP-N-acetylmuramate-alanine ligase